MRGGQREAGWGEGGGGVGGSGKPRAPQTFEASGSGLDDSFQPSIYICQVLTLLCATGSEQRCAVGAHKAYIGDLELYKAPRGLGYVQGIIRLPKLLAWPHMAW